MESNRLLSDNYIKINHIASKCMRLFAILILLYWVFTYIGGQCNIVLLCSCMGLCCILTLIPTIFIDLLKNNEGKCIKYVVIALAVLICSILNTTLSYTAMIVWIFPMLVASLYYNKTMVLYTALLSTVGVFAADIVNYRLCDLVIPPAHDDFADNMILVIAPCVIAIFIMSFVGIFLLQTVKASYRQAIWYNDYSGSKVEFFFSLLVNNAININEVRSEKEETTIARYNQGWIISRIYNNIPQNHDFLGGRTYVDAFNSAILPRFLFPNKKGAGAQSREDFIEMTGYHLSRGTSMGLSILGESYGNFGLLGGTVFMFIWGVFIAKFISFIDRLSIKDFLWIMFLPIICFNLIKAEISMMSVLNWTVKSVLFVGVVIYLLRHLVMQLQPIVEKEDDDIYFGE